MALWRKWLTAVNRHSYSPLSQSCKGLLTDEAGNEHRDVILATGSVRRFD
jgi:hypothetical protein